MEITGLYAGLCGLLLLALSARIVRMRWKYRVGLGGGGEAHLQRAIRVQGNFIEYVPLILLLLAAAESQGAGAVFLHVAGSGLVVARVAHALGLSRSAGRTPERFIGTSLTWLILAVLSVANLSAALSRG